MEKNLSFLENFAYWINKWFLSIWFFFFLFFGWDATELWASPLIEFNYLQWVSSTCSCGKVIFLFGRYVCQVMAFNFISYTLFQVISKKATVKMMRHSQLHCRLCLWLLSAYFAKCLAKLLVKTWFYQILLLLTFIKH